MPEPAQPCFPWDVDTGSALFVGTLSGTSIDAVDAALVRFGPGPELVATHSEPFPAPLQAELRRLALPGPEEIDRLGRADVALGRLVAHTVHRVLETAGVPPAAVAAIGSHGQTVRHRPAFDPSFTLQIGDPNLIAAETGIPVVADFRRKDVALGGQGAPLVPAFHAALFRTAGVDRAVVNIGGIANVTLLPGDPSRPIVGYDTGPGNTLLDAWARQCLGTPMDREGAFAAKGRIQAGLLDRLLDDPFFAHPPPKSTGPEYFSLAWLRARLESLGATPPPADVQATLVALTVISLRDALLRNPGMRLADVLVCGGGARNPVLMRALAASLPGCDVAATDARGVPGAWVEAMAFAWLARQRLLGLPGNCPEVTGARREAVLGGLYLPG